MKRVLITGTSGFVAHHLVEHILKNTDWEIIGVDKLDYASQGYDRLRDIEAFDNKRVRLLSYNLCSTIEEGFIKEIGSVDYILHLAANSHVDNSISDPKPFIINNIESTLNMLELARTIKPKKFVYFSTDEVYGTAPDGLDYKEGDRYNPGNPYSASKAASECLCYAYSNTYKVPILITNTMNVLGERQHPEKYLPKIINCVRKGEILPIHSNSSKTKAGSRYYIHARNVADGLLYILEHSDETLDNLDAGKGKYHIVGEKELDNLQLAQLVERAVQECGIKQKYFLKYEMVDFHSSRPGHDLRYGMSGDKLSRLGWEPPVSIEESVKNIVDWSLEEKNVRWLGE